MKTYKILMGVLLALLVLYIIAEYNRPQPIDWTITLQQQDKNPFGAYILHKEIQQLFPSVTLSTERQPVYNTLENVAPNNSAYILIAPELDLQETDINQLLNYVHAGNYVFISSSSLNKKLSDTLGIEVKHMPIVLINDSVALNFANPAIKSAHNYFLKGAYYNAYISTVRKKDSCLLLGSTNKTYVNFIRLQYGSGAFFIHTNPQCFSNYFLLNSDNYKYAATALSYLPAGVQKMYWDEYYKQGRSGSGTPLRFFLSNTYLSWALWLVLIAFALYIYFEMKRRQRIIPVIEAPRNTSLEFVNTISSVYLSHRSNTSIARKKIQFWMDNVHRNYYLQSTELNDEFVEQLSRKSGTSAILIKNILDKINLTETDNTLSNAELLILNKNIDDFYKQTKIKLHE